MYRVTYFKELFKVTGACGAKSEALHY